jgi:hypothetical protein
VGASAGCSVLGGRAVAQGRVAVSVVVLALEVADDHAASSTVFQWLRLRHSLRSRLLNDSMCPLFHGVPGGIYAMPVLPLQNCCSA